jgi:hypothetical protein
VTEWDSEKRKQKEDKLKEEIDTAYTALVAEKKALSDVQAGGKRRYRKTYRSRR